MTDRVNPWVIPPQPPQPPASGPPVVLPDPSPGSPAIQRQVGAVPAPAAPLGSRAWRPQDAVRWWALGTHGGAGVSTLLRALGGSGGADACRRWPDMAGALGGVHVLLVARTDVRGLDAVTAAVQEWTGGHAPRCTEITGLALLADAPGRPTKLVRDRIRLLSGTVLRVWEVPWVEEWRDGALPSRPVKALVELQQALQQLTLPPAPPTPPALHADWAPLHAPHGPGPGW